jgi:hypothetical protein
MRTRLAQAVQTKQTKFFGSKPEDIPQQQGKAPVLFYNYIRQII